MGYSFMFSSGSLGDKGCLWFKSNWLMSWRFLNFLVMCTSYLHCKASLLLVAGFFLCVVSVFYSCLLFFFPVLLLCSACYSVFSKHFLLFCFCFPFSVVDSLVLATLQMSVCIVSPHAYTLDYILVLCLA
jgi:hypothetical protein